MHADMICDCSLSIAVFLHSLGDLLVPFAFVHDYTLGKHFVKRRPVCVSLALGYFRNIFMPSEMIGEAVNKVVFAKKCLALNLAPDGFLANPPFHKLAVFFLCLGSCSTELSEYPICDEAGMGRLFPCCGPVAGPFPVFWFFDHLRADRIKNYIAADFQKVRVLLNKYGLVPALEKVPGLVVTFVPRLSINAV